MCVPRLFPFHEAEQVLQDFREQFIGDMDSTKVIWDLLEMKVIDEGNLGAITETKDTEQQNKMLHYYLKKKCTLEALKTVCK